MTDLHAEPLTPTAFEPFGSLIARPNRRPDLVARPDQEECYELLYWDRIAAFGEALVSPNLGILQLGGRPRDGLIYTNLEIIPDAAESYFALGAIDAVLVVAPGSLEAPDLEAARAFRLGGASVVINAGIWHQHPLPIGAGERFHYGLLTSNNVIVRQPAAGEESAHAGWSWAVNGGQVMSFELPSPLRVVV